MGITLHTHTENVNDLGSIKTRKKYVSTARSWLVHACTYLVVAGGHIISSSLTLVCKYVSIDGDISRNTSVRGRSHERFLSLHVAPQQAQTHTKRRTSSLL